MNTYEALLITLDEFEMAVSYMDIAMRGPEVEKRQASLSRVKHVFAEVERLYLQYNAETGR